MQHHTIASAPLWASFKLFCNFDLYEGRVYRSHVALDDTGLNLGVANKLATEHRAYELNGGVSGAVRE